MSAGQCFSWMFQCVLDINMQEEPGCLPMGHMQVCTPGMPEDCKLGYCMDPELARSRHCERLEEVLCSSFQHGSECW